MDKLFLDLLSCDRDSLMDYILEMEMDANSENEKLALLYAKILSAYFQADVKLLDKYIAKLETLKDLSPTHEIILEISKVRKSVREHKVYKKSLERLSKMAHKHPEWKGEIYFVCGFAYSRVDEQYKARQFYLDSYQEFNAIGLEKKGLLALQNYVAVDGLLHPEKRAIPELQMIIRKAQKIKAPDVEGLVTMNLSVEYEEIGAKEAALEYAWKAVQLLDTHRETYQHASAACHLCRLLFEMNHINEANKVLGQIKTSRLPEIQANIQMLEQLRSGKSRIKANSKYVLPWWEEDFEGKCKNLKLGRLGEKLVRFLVEEPRSKEEIIRHLYGDKIEFESLENRFYVLLSRLRKNHKDLLLLQGDGKYALKPTDIDFAKKDAS